MLIDMFNQAGVIAKLGILIAFGPVVCALLYVYKPTERRLALMRPLSLAAIFGGLTSFSAGVIAVLHGIASSDQAKPLNWPLIILGAGETVAALFFAFGCLTIAWLLVALGMRRTA